MKIKVSEATPLQLDWLVAKAQGRTEIRVFAPSRPTDRGWVEVRFNPEPKASTARFDPSENWSQGGPIIEREYINITHPYGFDGANNEWVATSKFGGYEQYWGHTPLIAAMRCFVALKLGDEVDVPEELLGGTNSDAN